MAVGSLNVAIDVKDLTAQTGPKISEIGGDVVLPVPPLPLAMAMRLFIVRS